MKVFIAFATIFCLVRTAASQCQFQTTHPALPANWSYSSVEHVRQCFQSIPSDGQIINDTMKQLFNALDFYSFLSLIRPSVDLRAELLNVSHTNTFQSDYDFHLTLVRRFKKLNDFHTKYIAPVGYGRFELFLPFILQYSPLNKQVQIEVSLNLYSNLTGYEQLKNYVGYHVTKIDGIDALDYLKNFARDNSLMSKDATVKLNSVFRREFWLRNLAEYPLPMNSNITFTLINSTEFDLTLPYVVLLSQRINDRIELESENRHSPSAIDTDLVFREVVKREKLDWYDQRRNNSFQYQMGTDSTFYYQHPTSQTAIIRLASFDEANADQIKTIFIVATGRNLILDLIGNRGGASCLAYALLNYLVPEYNSLPALYEPMDARITSPLTVFSSVFDAYPNSIFDFRTGQPFNNSEWIRPYVNYTRGSITEEYSMKWSINCDGTVFGAGQFWMRNATTNNFFQSIYALTDGTCGSACSLFLSKLKLASNFKRIYGIGGGYENDNNDLFESSSYAGGGAFSWNDIVTYHNQMSAGNSSIDYLPTSAFLNLNVYEIYIHGVSPDIPREFVKQPIDRRLMTSDYVNLQTSLEQIIQDYSSSGGLASMIHQSYIIIVLVFLFII